MILNREQYEQKEPLERVDHSINVRTGVGILMVLLYVYFWCAITIFAIEMFAKPVGKIHENELQSIK